MFIHTIGRQNANFAGALAPNFEQSEKLLPIVYNMIYKKPFARSVGQTILALCQQWESNNFEKILILLKSSLRSLICGEIFVEYVQHPIPKSFKILTICFSLLLKKSLTNKKN